MSKVAAPLCDYTIYLQISDYLCWRNCQERMVPDNTLPNKIAVPTRMPALDVSTNGIPKPQIISPTEWPKRESRHHSVSEAIAPANPSMRKSAPMTTGHAKLWANAISK
jgi:hypothetical protein